MVRKYLLVRWPREKRKPYGTFIPSHSDKVIATFLALSALFNSSKKKQSNATR